MKERSPNTQKQRETILVKLVRRVMVEVNLYHVQNEYGHKHARSFTIDNRQNQKPMRACMIKYEYGTRKFSNVMIYTSVDVRPIGYFCPCPFMHQVSHPG